MHYQHPDHTMRNIKKAASGGWQIQFIRNHKSHSDFSRSLDAAKLLRDAMEKELGRINQQFSEKPQPSKESLIPGTTEPMPAGISLSYHAKGKQYHVQVNWFKQDRKMRNK